MILLNSINLQLEKASKRQAEFEQTVMKKLYTSNKRMLNLEGTINTVLERLDEMKMYKDRDTEDSSTMVSREMFGDIPATYRITLEELQDIRRESKGPGVFALALTRRLFPELWGPGNLRHKYSYHGGGVCQKEELDQELKSIIVRYVTAFYPNTRKTSVWKDTVIPRINEGLRRDDEKRKEKKLKRKQTDDQNFVGLQPVHYE